ncbi:solute carrier family 12 sodium/potassium/chloride transporter 2 [Catalinimonas alkaloidigena]|uniref:Na-K-Cl cotransporter n=1 Tax=Catalinimonas alkaloidigena TaxID=1075417 RepID=UPI0024056213|nr:Na-K-Cl cotransporter [Catalinimonas alkaloidigena]MDF9796680.1 solute carrier family 12 sodium/potassium/chloride transporter 2 [Catalinimonas alkaloidigena]
MKFISWVKKKNSTDLEEDNGKLGTFGGVFVPSLLTILGVIMYLRFGWVVGNVGLFGTLIIVTLSTSITFLTALSIAAISTDQVVKTGGAYYMISRSLGIETGGAVGIPLFLAQALSVALYVIGFAESLTEVFPAFNIKVVGIVVTVLISLLALYSTQATIKTQYFILAAIALSLISLLLGKPLEDTQIEMWGAPAHRSENFWVVFAVFFPAVTGIMAGVNLSGDLKNPSKSIPKGTFMAVGVGYIIYMLLPIILAGRADATTLLTEPLIMRRLAWWGDAILLGVWGATLSSAVGSLLGAPRILQALASDRVLPHYLQWLGRGNGKYNIPRAGTLLTMVLAIVAVYLGNLDIIAPVLSMFFLTTYGVLNIAAGVENLLGSPSFRPSFRVHWFFSFLGAIGCLAVMFLINATATVVAAFFVSMIFIWLKRRGIQTAFGDVRRGVWLAIARSALLRVNKVADPKNWRPNILILSGAPTKRWHLITLGADFTGGQALMTVSTVIKAPDVAFERLQKMEDNIREFLQSRRIQALVRVVNAEDPFVGGERLVSMYGIGGLVPNTVMLGDTQEMEHHQPYCDMIRHFYQARRNVIIVRAEEDASFGDRKRIDLWWGGLNKNGGLMLLMAYLLQNSLNWQHADVVVKMVVSDESAVDKTRKNIDDILHNMRVKFERQVIVSNGRSFWEILKHESDQADLVMLGLAEPNEDFLTYYESLSEKTAHLPPTVFVLAAQELDFKDVLL